MTTNCQLAQPHIVIVEDDILLNKSLVNFLQKHNYKVSSFFDSFGVADFINRNKVNVLITDIILPTGCGYSLMRELKNKTNLGKIFISQKADVYDRIEGLTLGADDYICKPINSDELLLRLSALLTRLPPLRGNKETSSISFLNFDVNTETRELSSHNGQVELGYNEHQLLLALIGRQGKVCSRQYLMKVLKLNDEDGSRALDILVSRLRNKLKKIQHSTECIVTIRGKGYLLISALNK